MAAPKVMRVFINNIDSFSSGHIAECLSERAAVAPDQEDLPEPAVLQVVGTASEDAPRALEVYIVGEMIRSVKTRPNREELLFKLMQCDVVIYNISEEAEQVEEAMWAVTALHGLIGSFSAPKMFILISTVMTWASSKPVDPDDPTLPFTDEIFWSRKAHLNFVRHIGLERRVAKMGKTNREMFSTYVVASGLQYGMGEHLFHYFFKRAWLGQEPEVSVFGDCDNVLPTIHIRDLASIIQHVIHHRPRPYYLLAVDGSNNSMEEIIKAVASTLGPGKIQKRPVEEALLVQDLSAADIDFLLVNLRMEAVFIRKLFSIRWHCEFGLVENVDLVVEEYRQSRGLLPIRICVLGPPAAGKSTVSKELCQHYKLHYITLRDTVFEAIAQLEDAVNNLNPETDDSTMKDLLNSLKDSTENSKDVSENQLKVLKDKLMSNPCRNQGFVLDGFPNTYEQAKELFGEEDDETSHNASFKRIVPEVVFTLDASDNLLVDRVMNLPESVVQEHKYHQENFKRRLTAYRKINADEETVLTFFTEMDIPSWHLEITSSSEADNRLLIHKILQTVGPPRSYSPSRREIEEEERKKGEETMKKEALEKAEKDKKEAEEEEARRRAARLENWSRCLEVARRHKEEPLKAEALSYLKKEVMPTLVQALSECCRLQPPDPVDFVAEYLVKNNPTDKPA
ncbi:adenylate kinase 7 isoform X2 [Oryzias melastigma]|uniref:adenylate kinase 7 isoform X2 n=1 Tax=Oryzias melastigma TaxID=30732 RepID=UPI000CF80AF6|nr:adenylate kinase 7 isoform X2 [Oryzias melastigma]